MKVYQSPIQFYVENVRQEMIQNAEKMIIQHIHDVDINVNREELIQALNYDRNQYEKGYADAKAEVRLGKWHSVSDPPKNSGRYIVACNQWGGNMRRCVDYLQTVNEWVDGGKIISEYVTHWTDFPELPQEYEE